MNKNRYRNKKILAAARDQDCAMQLPGACNHDPSTTVFAHFNESWAGKGMGQKADDCAGMFLCSECHRSYDERRIVINSHMILRAYYRTIRSLLDMGVLK